MKKKLLWVVVALTLSTQVRSLNSTPIALPTLKPYEHQSQAAHLSAEILMRHHYLPVPLDDSMSRKVFDRYLKSLDPERLFFVQADIDQLTKVAANQLDDAILNENLAVPYAIFNHYQQRVDERYNYARSLLAKGFDFTVQESYQYDREKEPWAKTDDEVRDQWRKRVKNDWLRLKLAGRDAKGIAETLEKRYSRTITRMHRLKGEDVFQIFMNSYATAIEPHTNYLGPRESEDFDMQMRLSLVGIGAVLQERDEYTLVREIMAGGPAELSGKIKPGDRIVGVRQGEKGPMTDVLGWRLDDTVALIRGAPDSVVSLDILPADAGQDGKHKIVTLVRKKISMEQQAAKKSVLEVKDGEVTRKVGVIALPTFYQDFGARQRGETNFKSATRDVERLLGELKKEKVDSVLVDLRNNSGGSLAEAIELTGLFISKGPVVQQRDAEGKITVQSDTNSARAWDGPLGVLVNRGSASASEIFAAAVQDYGRGLVIGEQSYGKGTVQTLVNLDQMASNKSKRKFGELKMTVAQFFRINGGTTQLRGVNPDILFPSAVDTEEFGESSYDNALPWVMIKPADYTPLGERAELLPLLQARHEARAARDQDFKFLKEDIAEFTAQRKKNSISLNEAERRKERDVQEARAKLREQRKDGKDGKESEAAHRDDGLMANERSLASELAAEKAAKNRKDVLLQEAANILGDEVGLLKADRRLAARVSTPPSLPTGDKR